MPSQPSNIPAWVVAIVAWVCPGAGYFLIGQRGRAITTGVTIILLYVLGLLIGGMRVVEAPGDYLSHPMHAVMEKPWIAPQILNGPMCMVTLKLVEANQRQWQMSHSRVNEIGTLYTAVAGMLNLLAIIDSAHRAAYGRAEE